MNGILFKPDMIKAIVGGTKTQTRRLGGLKEINEKPNSHSFVRFNIEGEAVFSYDVGDGTSGLKGIKPRYHVGEVIYIKEAWTDLWRCNRDTGDIAYKLGLSPDVQVDRWYSPLFMPAWAARYFILITNVKAQRLQEISWEDCLAEGVIKDGDTFYPSQEKKVGYSVPQGAYIHIWDSINYPKQFNPWLFAYTFKLVEMPKE
jgi:hypothetical protein